MIEIDLLFIEEGRKIVEPFDARNCLFFALYENALFLFKY